MPGTLEQQKENSFLCSRCKRVYFSSKKKDVCPYCHTKNKSYQVKPLYCPYCGGTAYLRHKSEIFTKEQLEGPMGSTIKSDYLYVCSNYPECNAFVYTHPRTKIPYGHLANAELRRKRIFAHDCIASMIQLRIMSKNCVYNWLSSCLGYRRRDTHISQMNDAMCEKTIELTLNAIKNHDIKEYHRLMKRRKKLLQQYHNNTSV